MGGLIGIASKSDNGLMSRNQAIRSINKNNNIYCCLRLGIYEAGQVLNGFLYVTNVAGAISTIAVSAVVWNSTKVYCKLINGVKGDIGSLSYIRETNSISLYIRMTSYANISFVPLSIYNSSSLETVSSIPSDAINIDF